MENNTVQQLYSLLIYLLSGFFVGILFDIFRILRKTFKTPDIVTYIEDILFWLLTGLYLIYISLNVSDGQIRIYNIIGLIIGIITYLLLFSKIFIKVNVKIMKIILFPIKKLFSILSKMTKPFTFFVINIKKYTKDLVKKRKIIKYKKEF